MYIFAVHVYLTKYNEVRMTDEVSYDVMINLKKYKYIDMKSSDVEFTTSHALTYLKWLSSIELSVYSEEIKKWSI
jgi:hypothetical protein